MYGDEGDDELWGSKGNAAEYLWGGADDDLINPGQGADTVYANGNEGDDTIEGSIGVMTSETIRGGKGDDIINPIELVYNSGVVDVDNTEWVFDPYGVSDFNYGTGARDWDGGEGDDVIWGASKHTGTLQMLGGNGQDTIYAPFAP